VDPYRWSWDPDALVVVPGLAVAYAIACTRFPAPPWRIACFAGGCALMLGVLITPLDTLALHSLLLMHLLQNVVLAEWAPLLCVLGLTAAMAAALERIPGARIATHPFVALPVWLATYYTWHVPWAYDAALRHQWTLLHVEHAMYFAAGCLVWWPVVHGRLAAGGKVLYVFAAFVLAGPLGLGLALLPRPVYDFYAQAPELWGLSHLADQQIAGVTMAAEQAVVLFAALVVCVRRFFHEEGSADTYRVPTVRRS
jgi:cytochrome c oxidase assembly factor CtaG